jgi:hypothetical protein
MIIVEHSLSLGFLLQGSPCNTQATLAQVFIAQRCKGLQQAKGAVRQGRYRNGSL